MHCSTQQLSLWLHIYTCYVLHKSPFKPLCLHPTPRHCYRTPEISSHLISQLQRVASAQPNLSPESCQTASHKRPRDGHEDADKDSVQAPIKIWNKGKAQLKHYVDELLRRWDGCGLAPWCSAENQCLTQGEWRMGEVERQVATMPSMLSSGNGCQSWETAGGFRSTGD